MDGSEQRHARHAGRRHQRLDPFDKPASGVLRGIGLKALDPGSSNYLLWAIIGYMIATAVLVVAFGRLGDRFGRAKMYDLGSPSSRRRCGR